MKIVAVLLMTSAVAFGQSSGPHVINLEAAPAGVLVKIQRPTPETLFAHRGYDRDGDGKEEILIRRGSLIYQVQGQENPPAVIELGLGFGGVFSETPFGSNYFKLDGMSELIGKSTVPNCNYFTLFGPNSIEAYNQITQLPSSPGFRFCDVGSTFIGSMGDVSGDGIDDIAIRLLSSVAISFGMDRWTGSTYALAALVVDGSSGGGAFRPFDAGPPTMAYALGDIDASGVNDMMIEAGSPGTTWIFKGPFPLGRQYFYPADFVGSKFVRVRNIPVASAEIAVGASDGGFDFNGDGIDDFVLSLPSNSIPGSAGGGSACVVYGFSGEWPSELNIGNMPSDVGICVRGDVPGRNVGQIAKALGDIDGDGYDDFITVVTNPRELLVVLGGPRATDLMMSDVNIDSGRVLQVADFRDHIERLDGFDGDSFGEFLIETDRGIFVVRGSKRYFAKDSLLIDGFESQE